MKKDNTYNDKFLDELADKLLEKLLETCSQPEWHVRRSNDFVNNLSGIIAFKENEEERLIGELSKLMTLMVMYQEKEIPTSVLLLMFIKVYLSSIVIRCTL